MEKNQVLKEGKPPGSLKTHPFFQFTAVNKQIEGQILMLHVQKISSLSNFVTFTKQYGRNAVK